MPKDDKIKKIIQKDDKIKKDNLIQKKQEKFFAKKKTKLNLYKDRINQFKASAKNNKLKNNKKNNLNDKNVNVINYNDINIINKSINDKINNNPNDSNVVKRIRIYL